MLERCFVPKVYRSEASAPVLLPAVEHARLPHTVKGASRDCAAAAVGQSQHRARIFRKLDEPPPRTFSFIRRIGDQGTGCQRREAWPLSGHHVSFVWTFGA